MSDRQAYREKLQGKLNELKAEIDRMDAKAQQAGADAKLKLNNHVSELRKKHQALQQRLSDLGSATESAWDDLKEGCEKSWQDFADSVEQARQHFE